MNHKLYIIFIALFLMPFQVLPEETYGYTYAQTETIHRGNDIRYDINHYRVDSLRTDQKCDSAATYCDFTSVAYYPDSLHLGKWDVQYRDTSAEAAEVRTQRFYDTLKVRSQRNKFWRFIHGAVVVPSSSSKPQEGDGVVVNETDLYGEYNGKTISSIEIDRLPIFTNARSYLEKGANAVHAMTSQYAIKRDLLFKTGQKFDADVIVRNKQLLRSRQYIANANIVVEPDPDDPSKVIVKVITQDSWTISGDGSIRGLTGQVNGQLYDVNFLGSGDKFSYQLSLDWKKNEYQGSMFQYYVPNLFGTFYNANIRTGRSFTERYHGGSINKQFIHPTDYEIGGLFENVRNNIYVRYESPADTVNATYQIHYNHFDLWGGGSWYKPKLKSSMYLMGRYDYLYHLKKPFLVGGDAESNPDKLPIGEQLNPYFYDQSLYLASLGLYREKFYTTSLIYGYGYSEYVAMGYKTELTLGYLDAEYNPGWYGGFSFRKGGFTPIGYFMGDMSIGGFFDFEKRKTFRSALNVKVDYFTNLIGRRRFKVRQFASLNYLNGWNRLDGFYESVWFTKQSGPRELRDSPLGNQRFVINTETVVFTPWQLLGFRMALYGFVDVGFLGFDRNVFRNDIYSSIGVGIRMRNEMLVFGTIQLSFFVSLNKRGALQNDWVKLTSEQRLQSTRFMPGKPHIVDYR